MKRAARAIAALVCVVALAPGARAAAGPVKHWGTFPGREVRALSFAGNDFGAEPRFAVVPGRDGYVYLRGAWRLYRVLDANGRIETVVNATPCLTGGTPAVDTRSRVPRTICWHRAEIDVASGHARTRLRIPERRVPIAAYGSPGTPGTFAEPPFDVIAARGGGWWVAYTLSPAVGYISPHDRVRLIDLRGIGHVVAIAAWRDDVLLATDRCVLGRVHRLALVEAAQYASCRGPRSDPPLVATRDGAVWLFATPRIERIGPDGRRSRWTLNVAARDVAVARDGTAYVLASTDPTRTGHPVVAIIARNGAVDVRTLPMRSATSIAVDARDRIWITDPDDHAAAVIAPPGAWG